MPETGYSRSPKLIKGALIQFSAPMLIPVPNVIIFQYNPETMTRTLNPWKPVEHNVVYGNEKELAEAAQKLLNELTQPYDPDESFSLSLELDAADAMEVPELHPVARLAGVADRLAALEMLCYPPGPGAIGGLLNVPVKVSLTKDDPAPKPDAIPRLEVPIVLFFWGPGRIVPVRITTFSVEEQQYSPLLYPLRAKVSLGLTVLDGDRLVVGQSGATNTAVLGLARACYQFTRAQKKALADASLLNSVESIIGMLPV